MESLLEVCAVQILPLVVMCGDSCRPLCNGNVLHDTALTQLLTATPPPLETFPPLATPPPPWETITSMFCSLISTMAVCVAHLSHTALIRSRVLRCSLSKGSV